MFNYKSKIGFSLIGLYSIISAYYIIYSYNCNGMYCGLAMIVPVLPWIILFESILDQKYWILGYIFFIILNLIIIYFIGLGITLSINKIKSFRSD